MDPTNCEDPSTPLYVNPTDVTRSGFLGKRRAWNTLDRREWWFLGIVSVTLAVVLGLTSYRLSQVPETSHEFTLAILVLFNIGFCYIYAYHGVLFEQPNEICFLVLSTAIIWLYSVLGYALSNFHDSVNTGNFLLACLIGPIIVLLGFKIGSGYRINGDSLYRIVGGDPIMQAICWRAQLQISLLAFDAQAVYSYAILFIHAKSINPLAQLFGLIIGSIFNVAWFLLGYFSVRFEKCTLMIVYFILCIVQLVNFLWNFVEINLYLSDQMGLAISCTSGVLYLFIHIFLIFNTYRVYQNFGKGLKERIFGEQWPTSQYGVVHEVVQT